MTAVSGLETKTHPTKNVCSVHTLSGAFKRES
jgi:hypothetical protein